MAVYSMTGYALAASKPASAEGGTAAPGASVTVEARSVNGRFLDLAFRLPDELRGLEPALRDKLTAAFRRGKIELRIATTREGDGEHVSVAVVEAIFFVGGNDACVGGDHLTVGGFFRKAGEQAKSTGDGSAI